jgi:hypothetical protein
VYDLSVADTRACLVTIVVAIAGCDEVFDLEHVPVPGESCDWAYAPSNFDPCELPAPASLDIDGTLTINSDTTTLPHAIVTQPDGTQITVVSVSSLRLDSDDILTTAGTRGVVLAISGDVTVAGRIDAQSGANNATHCAGASGAPGAASMFTNAGGGGGAGGAAAAAGGAGGAGNAIGAGAGATSGTGRTATLSPLVGGCAGGAGGPNGGIGAPMPGGSGGGAIQLSVRDKLTVAGVIAAVGMGGTLTPIRSGGGGGGSGGGVLLEAALVEIQSTSRICADGGSGSEGGGSSSVGEPGSVSPCNGMMPASTEKTNAYGGGGGDGGFRGVSPGAAGTTGISNGGGGGGGGGGVGWIRIRSASSPAAIDPQAAVSPAAQID